MTPLNMLHRTLWRMQYEKSQNIDTGRISVLAGKAAADLYRFNDYIESRTTTRLESLYRLRLYEIDAMLRRYGVRRVCEMGTGRTTYFLNLYADLEVVSFEQDEDWRNLMLDYYREAGLQLPRIERSDVECYKNGGRFVSLRETQCDLLYIDGPYVNRRSGGFSTFMGKPAYYDFERILDAGLPKVIMIEGRTGTVDEILNSRYAESYGFVGELTWALQRNRYLHALRLRRHSIFIRKN